jgi:alkanesulfonate monooxygenase SsuD/methylene tetrahydromethanopterin reductase-like flavin-dependent oxidoreductase (luciferase family)
MPQRPRYFPIASDVAAARHPLWVGSWGSDAGLARVARAADGWLAFAYNTTPERFSAARAALARARAARTGPRRLPQRARDDVDLGREGSRRASACPPKRWLRCSGGIPASSASKSASVPRSTARSCSRATPRPAACGFTCGRWATRPRQLELIAAEVAPLLWGNRL